MNQFRWSVITVIVLLSVMLVACSAVFEARLDEPAKESDDAIATIEALATENAGLESQIAALTTPTPALMQGEYYKLAYVSDGDIWVRISLDDEAQRLTQNGRNHSPCWSQDGRWLAYQSDAGMLYTVDTATSLLYTLADGGPVSRFAWSPAEERLAFVVGSGVTRLIVSNPDGSNSTTLVDVEQEGVVGGFAWSPDGRSIAFERGGPSSISLGIVSLADSDAPFVEELNAPEAAMHQFAGWTADGRHLLYWESETVSASLIADGASLNAISVDGREHFRLAESVLLYPGFVDVGPADRVAIVSGSGRETWNNKRLQIVFVGAGSLGFPSSPERFAVSYARWSPDGLRLAAVAMPQRSDAPGGETERVLEVLGQRKLFLSDGRSEWTQLTRDTRYRDEHPIWSMDGNHLFFIRVDGEGKVSLWLTEVEHVQPVRLVDDLSPAPHLAGYYGYVNWASLFDIWLPHRFSAPIPRATPAYEEAVKPTPKPELSTALFESDVYGVRLSYPTHWVLIPGYGEEHGGGRYGSDDGFFQVAAISGEGMTIDQVAELETGHRLQPYGSKPRVDALTVAGQEARLILPSEDQSEDMRGHAALLVSYPSPRPISDVTYGFFVLYADVNHIRELSEALTFFGRPGEIDRTSLLDSSGQGTRYTDPLLGFSMDLPGGWTAAGSPGAMVEVYGRESAGSRSSIFTASVMGEGSTTLDLAMEELLSGAYGPFVRTVDDVSLGQLAALRVTLEAGDGRPPLLWLLKTPSGRAMGITPHVDPAISEPLLASLRPLSDVDLGPAILPPAGLFFSQEDGLWVIDEDGEKELLIEHQEGVLSADGRAIVLREAGGEALLVEYLPAGPRRLYSPEEPMEMHCVQWFPSGKNIILFAARPLEGEVGPGLASLWALDIDSGQFTQLSDTWSNSCLAGSPDGKLIAFDRDGSAWLYTWESRRAAPLQLERYGLTTPKGMRIGSPSWSADSQQVAWIIGGYFDAGWRIGVLVIDLEKETSQLLHLYEPVGMGGWPPAATWSPDGKWLAVNTIDQQPDRVGVWLVRADGYQEEEYHVLWGWRVPAFWSHDGRWLAMQSETSIWIFDSAAWSVQPADIQGDVRLMGWKPASM